MIRLRRPIVRVRIRDRIVEITVETTYFQRIVPITADNGTSVVMYIPISFLFITPYRGHTLRAFPLLRFRFAQP